MDKLTQREFLERTPPGVEVCVTDAAREIRPTGTVVETPELELHCPECKGTRNFAPTEPGIRIDQKPFDDFLTYVCRNCRRAKKTYAIAGRFVIPDLEWVLVKYGEVPTFGPPMPSRALSLIGPDRELFLKGRRCENQGLGVGAFVYYRRVVENQKGRIFDEIIRVSRHLSGEPELLAELEAAKRETQFTKAVESIKHALPQSLLINGHNPLTLLHSALSDGVHARTDDECLQLASSVRVVLADFAERVGLAMKDEAELNAAVNRLTGKRDSAKPPTASVVPIDKNTREK